MVSNLVRMDSGLVDTSLVDYYWEDIVVDYDAPSLMDLEPDRARQDETVDTMDILAQQHSS